MNKRYFFLKHTLWKNHFKNVKHYYIRHIVHCSQRAIAVVKVCRKNLKVCPSSSNYWQLFLGIVYVYHFFTKKYYKRSHWERGFCTKTTQREKKNMNWKNTFASTSPRKSKVSSKRWTQLTGYATSEFQKVPKFRKKKKITKTSM